MRVITKKTIIGIFLLIVVFFSKSSTFAQEPIPLQDGKWGVVGFGDIEVTVEDGTISTCQVGGYSCTLMDFPDRPISINAMLSGDPFTSYEPNFYYPFTSCVPNIRRWLEIIHGKSTGETLLSKDNIEVRVRDASLRYDFIPEDCRLFVASVSVPQDVIEKLKEVNILVENYKSNVAIGPITALYGYTSGYQRWNVYAFHEGLDTRSRTLVNSNGEFIAAVKAPFTMIPFIVRSGVAMGLTTCDTPDSAAGIVDSINEILEGTWQYPDCGVVLLGGFHVMPEVGDTKTRQATNYNWCDTFPHVCAENEGVDIVYQPGDMIAPCKIDNSYGWGTDQPHCHWQFDILPLEASQNLLNKFLASPSSFIVSARSLRPSLDLQGIWDVLYTYSIDPLPVLYRNLVPNAQRPTDFAIQWAHHPLPDNLAYDISAYTPLSTWDGTSDGDYVVGQPHDVPYRGFESSGGLCRMSTKYIAGHICYPRTGHTHGDALPVAVDLQAQAARRLLILLENWQ